MEHYGLNVGLLAEGDPADLIRVDSLDRFQVLQTFIDGRLVADGGKALIEPLAIRPVNNFQASRKTPADFRREATTGRIRVIQAVDGELITGQTTHPARVRDGWLMPDVEKDILKIAVVNRYHDAPISVGFIQRFGIQQGAIASSVAHDSHNIIAVGTDDESVCRAVNLVVDHQGGIAAVSPTAEKVLPLPVAGLMSDQDGYTVGRAYAELDRMAKQMGSRLRAPFMTLSFMGLLVIPSLKLSDLGLFDGQRFEMTSLCV